MNAFVFVNLSKPHYLKTCKKVIAKLKKIEDLALIFSLDDQKHLKVSSDLTIKDADFIISIGGDGTLLEASKIAIEHDLPIVGINAGRAGYLCKYAIKDILDAKDNPFKELNISKRNLLKICYLNKNYLAINDAVFASKNAGYTIEIGVKTKNHKLEYHASGILVSTPTGSTAYNVSAGGCVLDLNSKCNVITPICPYDKEKRALVINDTETITINNLRAADPIDIYLDGKYLVELKEELKITKHSKKLKLIY